MADVRSYVLLTSAPYIAGSYVDNLAKEQGFTVQQLTIVTHSGSFEASAAPQQAFDGCFSVAQQPGHHTAAFLGTVAGSLKAGAGLTCYEPLVQGPQEAVDQLRKAMLLAGFVDLNHSAANQEYGLISVSASKPKYQTGAKASVSLKLKQKPKQSSWTLAADDDELLDDEDLLTEEDKQRPVVSATDDCEVSAGKKACKNCTCGRADAEAAVQKVDLTQDMIENPQSACGSCGLGDAFRCASCPYRGLPQFEMGKKIQLGGDFLTADA